MGRNRKFQIGQSVFWVGVPDSRGIVVDYKQDSKKRGRYLVFSHRTKETRWAEGAILSPASSFAGVIGKAIVSRVRKNKALGDRGCRCHCCIHVAIPPSQVNKDGTFKRDDT